MVTAPATDAALLIAAYFLGCFSTGYYLTRLVKGKDIRDVGSGSTGSRNVSRTLGAWGFTVVFAVDVAKGAAAVWLAGLYGTSPWVVCAVFPAVVLGHIWPVQLSFRGGKGLATALGGVVILDPHLLCFGLVLCGLFLLFWRNLIRSGLTAVLLTPAWYFVPVLFRGQQFTPVRTLPHILAVVTVCVLVLVAHRENIREDFFTPRPKPENSH